MALMLDPLDCAALCAVQAADANPPPRFAGAKRPRQRKAKPAILRLFRTL